MTLPDQPGGTSLDFDLLAELFGVSSGGEIPARAGLTQPVVEDLLKQREIKESPGWLGAADAAYTGLLPGVPLTPNLLMNMAQAIIGLPFSIWPGTGPGGFLGEIPNVFADVSNFFTNMTGFFGDGVDFNELVFDIPAAVANFVIDMIIPTGLIADFWKFIDWLNLFVTGTGTGAPDPGFPYDFPVEWGWEPIAHEAGAFFQNLRDFLTVDFTDTNFDVGDAIVGSFNGTLGLAFGWITYWYNAITGQSQPEVPIEQAAQQASTLAQTQAAQAAALADLIAAQQVAAGNKGIIGGDDFERLSTIDLGAGWVIDYDVAGTNHIATPNGRDASWVQSDFILRHGKARRDLSMPDAVTATNYQLVTAVEGDQTMEVVWLFGSDAEDSIFLRMNDTGTQYVRIILGWNFAQLMYANGGPETQIGSTIVTSGVWRGSGVRWAGAAGTATDERAFQLFRDGSLVSPPDWVDSGAFTALGASNRCWGVGMGGGQQKPSSLTRAIIADNAPDAVLGSWLRTYRANTALVGFGAPTNGQLPTTFFDTVARKSDDLDWNGTLTVRDPGVYDIDYSIQVDYWNPGSGDTLRFYQDANVVAEHAVQTGPNTVALKTKLYCDANDILAPGYVFGAAKSLYGSIDGLRSYLQVAKVAP